MDIENGLLRINCSTKTHSIEQIPVDLIQSTIGGKGLGTHYLLQELNLKIDPLGPENKLIITLGPLSGTIFPTGNRYGIFFKSPLTGGYFESYAGGHAAKYIRLTGFLMIIIEGEASQPTFIEISDNEVKFHDAAFLWGKDAIETHDILKGQFSGCELLCIGPAGENLVKIANVNNNKYHHCGRGGAGAVLGSKKIKAIIFKGTKKPKLNVNPLFKGLVQDILKKLREKADLYGPNGLYPQLGTASIVDWTNELCCLPVRYFTACYSDHADQYGPHAINTKILKKRTGCWNCPFTCTKYVEGTFNGEPFTVEGPEYETIALIGGVCDIPDISAIAMLNEYCDRAGIDTISAGSLCGLAIEAKRRNRISSLSETGTNGKSGFSELDYNQPTAVKHFMEDIVHLKGLGKDFAQGTKFVSEKYGLQDLAMHVKGLDFAGYEPRAFRGFTLSYGVSPEGPTHLRSVYHGIERNHPDRLGYSNKAEPMIAEENRMAIIDSLIVCKFIRVVLDWGMLTHVYNLIFEKTITADQLRTIANNMVTNSRRFNIREGFSRKDDYMPERTYKEVLTCRNGTQLILDRTKYDQMLSEYYHIRGWDENGNPPELPK